MSREDPCVVLERRLAENPEDAEAWFELAGHRFGQTQMIQAAVRMRMASVSAFFDLFDATKAAYDASVRLAPNEARYWAAKGYFLVDLHTEPETDAEALEAFERALALNPADTESWIHRAGVLRRRHDLAGTLECLRRATVLDPRSVAEHSWLFQELLEQPGFKELFSPDQE